MQENIPLRRGPLPYPASERPILQLIDGQWIEGKGSRQLVINPANGDEIACYAGACRAEIIAAAEAAGRALDSWSRTPAPERGALLSRAARLMRERADTIALDLTLEQGKPLRQARGEVLGSAAVLDWFAGQARRGYGRLVPSHDGVTMQVVEPRPVGAVAVLTPWNSPLGTSVRTVAAALAAGCTAVLKPAPETPRSAVGFAEAMLDAGLPRGVLNLLLGEAAVISAALIDHPAIRKISFTGSVVVGRQLARQAGGMLKPVALELGGHAPVIIFDDVDVEAVARDAAAAKFDNARQICISPSRFYVQRKAWVDFRDAMAGEIDRLALGEGWVAGVDIGPLANQRRADEIERLVQDGLARGATLVRGGERVGNRGYFYAPTLLTDLPEQSALLREEPFGPVVAMVPFDEEEDVLKCANSLPYGLAAYAFSDDLARLDRVGTRLEAGMIGLNNFAVSRPELPFTGVKDSGFGYACGEEGFENFVTRHTITRRATAAALL